METSSVVIVLGIIGSVASIVGLFIAAQGWRSKVIHVIYALVITYVAGLAIQYNNKLDAARQQLEEMHRIETQAQAILNSSDRSTEGSMDGFMLASLSFLEKYKAQLPDTYARAVKVAEASGLYATDKGDSGDMTHFTNLQQGSGAMYYLLKGVATSNGGKAEVN